MASHAEWAANAEDLVHNRSFAAQQLDLGQVSNQTGLSRKTIEDSLTREEITNQLNPRGALCRPKYRIGDTPLWAPSQVQDFHARRQLQADVQDMYKSLPTFEPDEADALGYVTNREIKERLAVHDQTVRRYQRNYADYPAPVGKLSRGGSPGVPELLRDWAEILEWAQTKRGITIPEEWAA